MTIFVFHSIELWFLGMSKMIIVANGIIRQDNQVLLIKQQGQDDPIASWALPGGVVRVDENLTVTLMREVREETGLDIVNVGQPGYITLVEDYVEKYNTLAFVFEVTEWERFLRPDDPD